jgi:coatomer subunit beta'
LVCIACEGSFFILKYNKQAVTEFFANGGVPDEDEGIESAFEMLQEISERYIT